MRCQDFDVLDIARFELTLSGRETCSLAAFLGSTLRGAFGHALKQAVCVMPHRDCDRCMVADRCIYPYLFETPPSPDVALLRGQQRVPHPFLLSPPSPFAPAIARATARSAHSEKAGISPASSLDSSSYTRTSVRADLRVRPSSQPPNLASASPGSIAPPILRKASNALPTLRKPNGGNGADGTSSGDGFALDRSRFAPGDEIIFGLTLMGRAIEYLPYVVFAVSEMARRGLGYSRARFDLTEVHLIDKHDQRRLIYSGDSHRITTPGDSTASLAELIQTRVDRLSVNHVHDPAFADHSSSGDLVHPANPVSSHLKLRFATPTRIKANGDLQAGLSFELLVKNLLRRVALLTAVHGSKQLELDHRGLIERAASVTTVRSDLHWYDWERWSNRQQTKMKLGGFVGEAEYAGELLNEFLPVLAAGEVLHLGGSTAFGLGRYKIIH